MPPGTSGLSPTSPRVRDDCHDDRHPSDHQRDRTKDSLVPDTPHRPPGSQAGPAEDRPLRRQGLGRLLAAAVLGAVLLAACGGGSGGEASGATQATTPPHGTAGQSTGEGEPAPQVSLPMFSGETRALSDFYGDKPLVVNFWASWCPPCVAEMPEIEEVHQAMGDRVNFLGINTQDVEDEAHKIVEQTGVTYPLAWDPDGELFQVFDGFGMPTTVLISADGRIVRHQTGPITGRWLEARLAEEFQVGAGS